MEKHLRAARLITRLLEATFSIGKFRFGIEPILGLFPIIGDFIGLFFSFYLIWIGHQMNIPEREIVRMTRHVLADFVLGIVPFLGDLTDFVYKANSKNLAILEKYSKEKAQDAEIIS